MMNFRYTIIVDLCTQNSIRNPDSFIQCVLEEINFDFQPLQIEFGRYWITSLLAVSSSRRPLAQPIYRQQTLTGQRAINTCGISLLKVVTEQTIMLIDHLEYGLVERSSITFSSAFTRLNINDLTFKFSGFSQKHKYF